MKNPSRPSLIALLSLISAVAQADTTVFTDNFSNGSTVNGASIPGGTPLASSTSYDIASTKAATTGSAISAGQLRLSLNAATTGGFVEAQALFRSSPITLASTGDYIDLTYTFANTSGTLLAGGTASYLWTGLYNSGGAAPVAGSLNNSGLNTTAGSAYATGNAAGWQGYASRISNGGTSQLYTRLPQTGVGTTSANQELLGNNVGSGAYNNPAGSQIGSSQTSAVALTAGAQYTLAYRLTYDAGANNLVITDSLYSGTSATGTPLLTQTGTASGATMPTLSFDGLAIGLRNSGTSYNPLIDISLITVTANIAPVVPEPSSAALALAGIAALGLIQRRHRN